MRSCQGMRRVNRAFRLQLGAPKESQYFMLHSAPPAVQILVRNCNLLRVIAAAIVIPAASAAATCCTVKDTSSWLGPTLGCAEIYSHTVLMASPTVITQQPLLLLSPPHESKSDEATSHITEQQPFFAGFSPW